MDCFTVRSAPSGAVVTDASAAACAALPVRHASQLRRKCARIFAPQRSATHVCRSARSPSAARAALARARVTALLSDALSELGYECLVIDTDHSNNGLYRKLGLREAKACF